MKPSYSISVDTARDLVFITMSGFFRPEDVARFEADRDAAHRQLTCGPNQHLSLVDIRGMHIQSQDAVASFSRLLANPRQVSKRIAFVVTQSLARKQVQRASARPDAAYFMDDIDAAERWLLSEGRQAA